MTTQQTQTLADFLLARIAEDERPHNPWAPIDYPDRTEPGGGCVRCEVFPGDHCKAQWECEAKRRIVEMQAANDEDRYLPGFHYKAQMIERTLRALALPYTDHPDYREEWRP